MRMATIGQSTKRQNKRTSLGQHKIGTKADNTDNKDNNADIKHGVPRMSSLNHDKGRC